MLCRSSLACPITTSIMSAALSAPWPDTQPWLSSPVLPTILSKESLLTHLSMSLRVWSISAISRRLRSFRWSPCFFISKTYTIRCQCSGSSRATMHRLATLKYASLSSLPSRRISSSDDSAFPTLAPTALYLACLYSSSSKSPKVSSFSRSNSLPSGARSSSKPSAKYSMKASKAPSGATLPSLYSVCAAWPIAAASRRTPHGSTMNPASGSSPTATVASFSPASHLPRSISNASFARASGSSSASVAATRATSRSARALSSSHTLV